MPRKTGANRKVWADPLLESSEECDIVYTLFPSFGPPKQEVTESLPVALSHQVCGNLLQYTQEIHTATESSGEHVPSQVTLDTRLQK
jgi:hypothetical protein